MKPFDRTYTVAADLDQPLEPVPYWFPYHLTTKRIWADHDYGNVLAFYKAKRAFGIFDVESYHNIEIKTGLGWFKATFESNVICFTPYTSEIEVNGEIGTECGFFISDGEYILGVVPVWVNTRTARITARDGKHADLQHFMSIEITQ